MGDKWGVVFRYELSQYHPPPQHHCVSVIYAKWQNFCCRILPVLLAALNPQFLFRKRQSLPHSYSEETGPLGVVGRGCPMPFQLENVTPC